MVEVNATRAKILQLRSVFLYTCRLNKLLIYRSSSSLLLKHASSYVEFCAHTTTTAKREAKQWMDDV
jgi:hypothetical protein